MIPLRDPLAAARLHRYALDKPWWAMRFRRGWTRLAPLHAMDGRLP